MKLQEIQSIPLNRDLFLRHLIRELAGILEEIIGYDEAAGYISLVGQNIGHWINGIYTKEFNVSHLNRDQVGEVLVDLKRCIKGRFSLEEKTEEKLVFFNSACPFEEMVLDRPSMCMMTSNVFGVIASQNLGYAKVILHETIANRCDNCKVTVYVKQTAEAEEQEGREYFGNV